MVDRIYKYPAQLNIGDILLDSKTKSQCIVKDFSVYTMVKNGETYRRSSWVQVDSAVYSPEVLFKKFRCNDIKQLEIAGSILPT